jgi:D-alanyl-D-alanine carboxypeptidase
MSKFSHPALKVIDHWLTYQLAQGDLPGFQVSIRQEDRLLFSKAFGYADIEKKEKYTPRHLGRIASQSKAFTSVLSLLFEDMGLLRLTDTLVSHLPEFREHRDKRFRRITLQNLLSNRSGIFRDSFDHNYWGSEVPFLSRAQLVRDVMAEKLIYDPEHLTKYSNLGFAIMGLVLEKVGAKPFTKLVTEHILSRLNHTQFCPDYNSRQKFLLAKGYVRKQFAGQRFKAVQHRVTDAMAPATGFCGNTDCTTDFLQKLYQTDYVLPKKQRAKLLSTKWPVKNVDSDLYGLGTIFSKVGDNEYVGHSGSFPGFASQTWFTPHSKRTFGFITNASAIKTFNAIRAMNEIFKAIELTFSPAEIKSVIVSEVMVENFISTIYVVGKSRALAFSLTGWLPTEEIMVFKKHKDHFYSDNLRGYLNVGEPLRFFYKAKRIVRVKFGGFESYPRESG